jgi:hypothetical protein
VRQSQPDARDKRHFRIWVAGRLAAGFAAGMEGGIEQTDTEDGTVLDGELVDQAHLHGVLDELRRLGIEVLRFETYQP